MPDTLQITRNDIRRAIGREYGFGEDPDNDWNDTDDQRVVDWIKKGESKFYVPQTLPEDKNAHKWSFLYPELYQTLTDGVRSYLLPEDFGGLYGREAYYSENTRAWTPLNIVPLILIDRNRSLTSPPVSSTPMMAYIGFVKSDGTLPQRQYLEVYPDPVGSFTVKLQYYSNPYLIGEDTPYPLGGQPHADTILEACLAAAEITMRPGSTTHRDEFQNRLRASIQHDRLHMQQTRQLGNYGDRGRETIRRSRTHGSVTYEGVDYSQNSSQN